MICHSHIARSRATNQRLAMTENLTGAGAASPDDQQSEIQQVAGGVLDTLEFWLSYFTPRFYSTAYIMLFLKLFAEPGMRKNELMLFLENNAKISRSTAERMIGDAHREAYIVLDHQRHGNALSIRLSDGLFHHCAVYLATRGKRAIEADVNYQEYLSEIDD